MNAAASLRNHVRAFLQQLGPDPGPMVVAVSGGPDSVALLRALSTLGYPAAGGRLIMAHVNHQLRGSESDADEAFVRDLHASLHNPAVDMRCERIDVASQTRNEGGNLESVARRLRYDWLTQVAHDVGAAWVATGHTADDQAETVLHRLLRGSGLQGLTGIAACRQLAPRVHLVRPLLQVTRSEVLEFLADVKQLYRLDSMNLDLTFTRNRIRHELLPLLARQYNPAIASILARLAGQAEEVHAHLETEAAQLLGEAELPRAGCWLVFDSGSLRKVPRHIVREMFRLVWAREAWPQGEMDFEGWQRVAAVALGEKKAGDLPGGVQIRAKGRVVQVGTSK